MRKLKLQVQCRLTDTLPDQTEKWTGWDDELKNYVRKITEPVDCIVLGRKLAQGFIPHWASDSGTRGRR